MYILGIILIIFGVLSFLKVLGIITIAFWNALWPLVLILLGVSLLKKKHCHHMFSGMCKHHSSGNCCEDDECGEEKDEKKHKKESKEE